MAYLARWDGPVNEKADPFIIDALFSPSDLRTRRHAQEMFIIPPRNDFTDNNNLKAAIMNYGGVYSAMEYDGGALNLTHAAYYAEYPAYWANHAITLVGWDDTFSRDNFLTVPVDYEGNTLMWIDDTTPYVSVPPGDGAFIAKNSWGTGFGSGGYFYISYYDPMIGWDNAVFTAEPLKNLKEVYQYDDLGWVANLQVGEVSDTAWFANVFRALGREQVAAVSFYTPAENSAYTVSIYTDPADGPLSTAGPVATKSGSFELAGYHTVNIDPPVPVNLGQRFSVVVRIRTPGFGNPVPVEVGDPYFLSSNAVAGQGESYVSSDGADWKDTTTIIDGIPNINTCVKAFTVAAVPPPDARFTAAPKKGRAPLKVTFRDRSLRRPVSWLWDFGDGTFSTEKSPVHTYTKAGTYTVNLTVKNNGGEDFTVKEGYVTVGEEKARARPYYDFKKKDEDTTPAYR
jgi:PKD repeat protein